MSNNLKYRQEKIQAKRKTTPWRQFVMEIGSWLGMTYHKTQGIASIYPSTQRVGNLKKFQEFINEANDLEVSLEKSFFLTFQKLYKASGPNAIIDYGSNENCEYADTVMNCKNVYLGNTAIGGCDNILYSFSTKENCSDVVDSFLVRNNSSIIYRSSNIVNSIKVFYSHGIVDCYECYFSSDLLGCKYCFGCTGLQNKSYYIKNKQYSPEERNTNIRKLLQQKEKFEETYHRMYINKGFMTQCKDCTGENCIQCTQAENIYHCTGVSGGRNLFAIGGIGVNESVYDYFNGGTKNNNHVYGVISAGAGSSHLYCSLNIGASNSIYYSYQLLNCSYCLGCIGLRNKSYCIFNKQYTKEERNTKVDEIFSQMEKDGTLGEFFPGSMNPFYFNDTAAYLIDDRFTKEEVEAAGYLRRDEEIKVDIPDWMDVVEVNDLGQYEGRKTKSGISQDPTATPLDDDGLSHNQERRIDPVILKKVIRDEEGNSYRVIKMEYDFLVKHGLPLPRKHRLDRLKGHFSLKAS